MSLQIKSSSFDFELKEEGDAMTIKGYGSTFGGDPDSYGDIIAPGAFAESLKSRMPKMLYQHSSGRICGVWDVAKEDGIGLYLEGHFINTTLGRDVFEEAKSGALDRMSIGFRTRAYEYDKDKDVRTLTAIELFEVSLVTFPANDRAIVTGVKEEFKTPTTIREFEEHLGELGFSKAAATIIATRGFKALVDRGEPDDLKPYDDFFTAINQTFTNG